MNMKLKPLLGTSLTTALIGTMIVGTAGCRKAVREEGESKRPAQQLSTEIAKNNLGSFPGAIYRSQAMSPIHWQPWTQDAFSAARNSDRLVMAVVALPQQPGFQRVLEDLTKDASVVSLINDNYVPVLVDGDAAREVGLLTADLVAEIRKNLHLPLFLWLSPDGNPVAWIPVPRSAKVDVSKLFNEAHLMVEGQWKDDRRYVINNSAMDNGMRRERFSTRRNKVVSSEQPAEDAVKALRKLSSLYDRSSRTFDEAGGLFPAGSLDLLASAAVHPGLPDDLRQSCLEVVREMMADVIPSPMFDPLDGGVFTARRGPSWLFPSFSRDAPTQARVVVTLCRAYTATGDKEVLAKALSVLAFAERNFKTSDDLYSVGMMRELDPKDWLWTTAEVEALLPKEDADWWLKATGMKAMGNLPSELDPRREYFRANSIGMLKNSSEIAKDLAISEDQFATRFEKTRQILLAAREKRVGEIEKDETSHAGSTFRMVSAYAAAYTATGDQEYRKKAEDLLSRAKEAFSNGPQLRQFKNPSPPSIGDGRAFLYCVALQATLDVADILSDEKWLIWADDLATTSAELFTGDGFLKECPDSAKIIDLPVTDLVMLFDDSSAGLVSMAEIRLAERDRPLVPSFSDLATPVPTYIVDRPILHTDLLQATLARHFRTTVVLGENVPAELKAAVDRLPIRMVQRRIGKSADAIPSGAVKVIVGAGEPVVVTSPEALLEVVLPYPPK